MENPNDSMSPVNLLMVACIVLVIEVAVLAAVAGLTVNENGRLHGEINRMESQLRNMRAK